MQPLKITAWMGSAIATYDDWSPSLDSLLEWLLLDSMGQASPNPTPEQVAYTKQIVDRYMPIAKGDIGGEWYWKCSSPCYKIQSEQISKFRKRWDYHDIALSWGKRKAKWSTSEGAEKSYDLPLYLRLVPNITWYVVGDRNQIALLLSNCKGIGKKRSHGHGQILNWEIEDISEDWHLYRFGLLMRPIPARCLETRAGQLLQWGWRPPAWLHSNQEACLMPQGLVQRA